VAPVEVDENRRAVLSRQALVVQAQRALDQAALQLSLYARTPLGAPRVPAQEELPDTFPVARSVPLATESVTVAVQQRPELARQRHLEHQARVDTRLAEQDLLPTVDHWLQASQDLATANPARHKPEVAGLVTVDVPIPSRAARGRVEAQEAAVRKVRHQTRWLEERIQADVKDVLNAWSAAAERVTLAQSELDVAQRLAQGELRRFDVGEGTLLLVNLREQAAAEAALRLLDAQLDVSRAQLLWKATTGQLFP
jgi:outer membrane protein TolC